MKTATIFSMISCFKILCCMEANKELSGESLDTVVSYIGEGKIPLTNENRKKIQKAFLEESRKIEHQLAKRMETNPILYDDKRMSEITFANLFPEKKNN